MSKACVWALSAAAACAAASAHAQDFPPGPPPDGAPAFAGLNVGGQLGAAIGGSGSVSASGVGGGAYVGYNLRNGPIVGGLEADTVLAAIGGDGAGGKFSQNWLTSVRVRGGWAFGNILAYGTVGPAFGTASFNSSGFDYDKTLHGYTFGAGGEVALTRQISARAEVRHYDFGAATYYMPSGAQKLTAGNNLLLVGLGAHF